VAEGTLKRPLAGERWKGKKKILNIIEYGTSYTLSR
jgi:hypothetical protein